AVAPVESAHPELQPSPPAPLNVLQRPARRAPVLASVLSAALHCASVAPVSWAPVSARRSPAQSPPVMEQHWLPLTVKESLPECQTLPDRPVDSGFLAQRTPAPNMQPAARLHPITQSVKRPCAKQDGPPLS